MEYRKLKKNGVCATCGRPLGTDEKVIIFKAQSNGCNYVSICRSCVDELIRKVDEQCTI